MAAGPREKRRAAVDLIIAAMRTRKLLVTSLVEGSIESWSFFYFYIFADAPLSLHAFRFI